MPQLSLYLNDAAMGALRADAAKEKMSLSRYVADLITSKREEPSWPDRYWEGVYGALADASFQVPAEPSAALDGKLPAF